MAYEQVQIREANHKTRMLLVNQGTHNIGDLVFMDPMQGKYLNKMQKYHSMLHGEIVDSPFPIIGNPYKD